MKELDRIAELIGEINKTRRMLEKINAFYREFKEGDFKVLGKRGLRALFLLKS